MPQHSQFDLKIEFKKGATAPFLKHSYKLDPQQKEALEKIIQENLDRGFIRKPKGKFANRIAAPTFLIGKKDGGYRMIIDYKKLNEVTTDFAHPIPLMEDLR